LAWIAMYSARQSAILGILGEQHDENVFWIIRLSHANANVCDGTLLSVFAA
jgi:hypothetical protein